jgi:2-polyprenyl-3-methyl-5-hydroxy-6-metoxy-1,4-benzoquinol methylase
MMKRMQSIIERERRNHPDTNDAILWFGVAVNKVKFELEKLRMRLKKDSTFNTEDVLFMCSLFPKKILDQVIAEIQPKSVLDVGSGTGVSLAYLIENGMKATGVENSDIAIEKSPVKEHIIKHNLNNVLQLNKKFDLVWCFEVIEHIHPDYEANFLQTLVNHADRIVLSAARPGQGGHGHFNEQEPAYWIKRFADLGYTYEEDFSNRLKATGDMHAENILSFRKS